MEPNLRPDPRDVEKIKQAEQALSQHSKQEFYAPDVETITGVKRLRLHQWIDRGYFTPSIKRARGSGTKNVFSRRDLYTIETFKRLIESGFSRSLAKTYIDLKGIDYMRTRFPEMKYMFLAVFRRRLDDGEYVLDPSPHIVIDQEQTTLLYDKLAAADDIFMINLLKLINEVDESIDKWRKEKNRKG